MTVTTTATADLAAKVAAIRASYAKLAKSQPKAKHTADLATLFEHIANLEAFAETTTAKADAKKARRAAWRASRKAAAQPATKKAAKPAAGKKASTTKAATKPATKFTKAEAEAALKQATAEVQHAVDVVINEPAKKAAAKKAATKAAKPAAKSTGNALGLPAGSYGFFVDLANDAGNWGGHPWFDGNVASGRSAAGYVKRLVAEGLIESATGEDGAYCVFTPAGIEAAGKVGIDLTWIEKN